MLKSLVGSWLGRNGKISLTGPHTSDTPELSLDHGAEKGSIASIEAPPRRDLESVEDQYEAAVKLHDQTHSGGAAARDQLLALITVRPDILVERTEFNLKILRTTAQYCTWFGPIEKAVELLQFLTVVDPNAADLALYSEVLAETDTQASAAALEKAIAIDPKTFDTDANRETLRLVERSAPSTSGQKTRGLNRYPPDAKLRGDLQALIEQHIAPTTGVDKAFIGRSTRFFTMGSCFARNVAISLQALGYEASHLEIAERVNTTFANRAFVEWLSGADSDVGLRFQELVPPGWSGSQTLDLIARADVFVLTLGAAMAFFDRTTGAFVLPRSSSLSSRALAEKFEFKMSSVADNVLNVRHLIRFIREANPNIVIVLTVSPVPLLVSFGDEPCVQTDCVSKSTMRLTAHEIVNDPEFKSVIYWPSFEVFRWIGSNNSDFYAADDGVAGHVTERRVSQTIAAFIERFKAPA